MSVVSVKARSFILALFIRDDGERFLLGDNGYEFKDSQLHFAANTIENDEVMKQGADGVMVAGQVRRASVQSFDGYVGDATMTKETIEQMRRDFFAFFIKGHHFRVVYIDCNRNAWQRKGGYLVDAPEVKELWQIHPEYHVGLNFEDVNYYSYDEDADGNEILANLVNVPVSTETEGGLVWDEDGAVSEDASDISYDTETADATPAKNVYITDAAEAPLASFRLDGETSQSGTPTPDAPVPVQVVTGENTVKITGRNLANMDADFPFTTNGVTVSKEADGSVTLNGTLSTDTNITLSKNNKTSLKFLEGQTVTLSFATSGVGSISNIGLKQSGATIFETATSPKTGTLSFGSKTSSYWQAWCIAGTTYNNYNIKIQFEKSATASSFEPYQEQSYPISLGSLELCKIGTYQDYIYKDGSDWKIHKAVGKVVLDGSEASWAYDSQYSYFRCPSYVFDGVPATGSITGSQLSNYFAVETVWATFRDGSSNKFFNLLDSGYKVCVRNTSYTDTTNFKTWLSSAKPAFYYALATPTDTEITNEALVAQLEAVLSGHTYAGTNNIFTITPNEQGTLEISYYTKYQPMVVGGGYVWEAGGSGGATIVVNNSIDNVNPIWKIYGPTMNPQLENSATGEVIEYVGMIAEGQTLTIDMGEQTASLDGLNVISNLVGDFISLAPGANRLIYSVLGDAGASSIGWSEIVG